MIVNANELVIREDLLQEFNIDRNGAHGLDALRRSMLDYDIKIVAIVNNPNMRNIAVPYYSWSHLIDVFLSYAMDLICVFSLPSWRRYDYKYKKDLTRQWH